MHRKTVATAWLACGLALGTGSLAWAQQDNNPPGFPVNGAASPVESPAQRDPQYNWSASPANDDTDNGNMSGTESDNNSAPLGALFQEFVGGGGGGCVTPGGPGCGPDPNMPPPPP